jgi:hypothetical protein
MLSRWMRQLKVDCAKMEEDVERSLALQTEADAQAARRAPFGNVFDKPARMGLGLASIRVGGGAAGMEPPRRLPREYGVVVVIQGFLDALLDMARGTDHYVSQQLKPRPCLFHPWRPRLTGRSGVAACDVGMQEIPQDYGGTGYIHLAAIAPLAKQRTDLLLSSRKCPRVTAVGPGSGRSINVRRRVFQALILHFSNVLNFDNRWNRLRVEANRAGVDALCDLFARDPTETSARHDELLAVPPEVEKVEVRNMIQRMSDQRTGLPPVRLMQVLLDATPEQMHSFHHMKELYYLGLNTVFLDQSPPDRASHRVHQVLALLTHMAEDRSLWGPFLVVTPRRELRLWEEVGRFLCPGLKVMPYYGAGEDREKLRSFWVDSGMYTPRSEFHLVVTHYEALLQDLPHFNRVHWQYFIVDDGVGLMADPALSPVLHSLLKLRCRRRLLLTPRLTDRAGKVACPLKPLVQFLLPTVFCVLRTDWPDEADPANAKLVAQLRTLVRRMTTMYTGDKLDWAQKQEAYDKLLLEAGAPAGAAAGEGAEPVEWLSESLAEEMAAFDWSKLSTPPEQPADPPRPYVCVVSGSSPGALSEGSVSLT